MNREESFLAGIKAEGAIEAEAPEAGADEAGKETPPASPADDKPKEGADGQPDSGRKPEGQDPEKPEGEDDDELPFHKHPRWKKVIEERNELREVTQRQEERLAALETAQQGRNDAPAPKKIQIPDWFRESFGENDEAWAGFREYDAQRRAEMKAEVLQEQESVKAQAVEESKKWDKWVDGQLDALEDEGLKFDRNRLLKVANDYLPSDSDGNIDFRKAYDILQKMEPSDAGDKAKAKKEAAGRAAPSPTQAKPEKSVLTSKDLRGKSFKQLFND